MNCSPLVSCVWLRQQLSQGLKNLRIIDGSWHAKSTGLNAAEEYNKGRINSSVFIDIDQLSDQSTTLPNMLPPTNQFGHQIGKLGINGNHHVIVYDKNMVEGMFSSARLWWMFKVFGHKEVSILDGGYRKWVEEGFPVSVEEPVTPTPVEYITNYREELVKKMEDIAEALRSGSVQVVDARNEKRYGGTGTEPRPGLPSGHMIGSVNLPYSRLFNPETKTLVSKRVIQEEFAKAGLDLNKPIIATCGSGVTACWISFAASLLRKEIPVYDGSWTEYAVSGPPETLALGKIKK